MPLQLDASPPEADIWGGERAGPRAAEFVHFCSGPYGSVCSFRPICRTLRAPPPQYKSPAGTPRATNMAKQPSKGCTHKLTFFHFLIFSML